MKYQITIKTISPVHIGTGDILLRDYDYKTDQHTNNTYVLNQDNIYEAFMEGKDPASVKFDQLPSDLLVALNITLHPDKPSPFIRYSLAGSNLKNVKQLRTQQKDAWDHPYISGSTLKGAIRSAVAVWLVGKGVISLERKQLGRRNKPEFVDDIWERNVFGGTPEGKRNHALYDVMRFLQISDSKSSSSAEIQYLNARVFQSKGKPASPVDLEAIAPKSDFETSIKVDEHSFQYTDVESRLFQEGKFAWELQQLAWFTDIPQVLRQYSRHLIETELALYKSMNWVLAIDFYQNLLNESDNLQPNEAFLNLGWGIGWLSQTYGLILGRKEVLYLQNEYNLGKPPKAEKDWKPDPARKFPFSRTMQSADSGAKDPVPDNPLGWVKLIFEERGPADRKEYWEELNQILQPLFERKWIITKWDDLPALPESTTEESFYKVADVEVQEVIVSEGLKHPHNLFELIPKAGDRFIGVVIDVEGRLLKVPNNIPDIDPELVYAYLEDTSKLMMGKTVDLEVIDVEEDDGEYVLLCKRLR